MKARGEQLVRQALEDGMSAALRLTAGDFSHIVTAAYEEATIAFFKSHLTAIIPDKTW